MIKDMCNMQKKEYKRIKIIPNICMHTFFPLFGYQIIEIIKYQLSYIYFVFKKNTKNYHK